RQRPPRRPHRMRKLHRLHPPRRQRLRPKQNPTSKKAKAKRKPRRPARPMPAGRTTDEAANPPAPGGGHGQVWVNTERGVYHREGSRFYGPTRKGKYMTEQDAIQAGHKRAPKRP